MFFKIFILVASNIMQMDKLRYINDILETRENVLGIIYIITNSKNGKKYIGQTLSHKLNAKKIQTIWSL